MALATESLVLDLIEWLAAGPQPYQEVMEAWRTSCPRLPVWEEATDRALVVRDGGMVRVTARGLCHLRVHRWRQVDARG